MSPTIWPGTSPYATAWSVSDARRAEIWLLDLGEPLGREQGWQRPALVVSSDEWNRHAQTMTVLPLTRTSHGLPTRIEIEPDTGNGLDEISYARCEDFRSVSERLMRRLGSVDAMVMSAIARTIKTFLELGS